MIPICRAGYQACRPQVHAPHARVHAVEGLALVGRWLVPVLAAIVALVGAVGGSGYFRVWVWDLWFGSFWVILSSLKEFSKF